MNTSMSGMAWRYGLVSMLALALDTGLYLLLVQGGLAAALSGSVGYAAGLVVHFLLSRSLVFDAAASGKGTLRLFGEFALTGLGGLGLTALTIAIATGGLGVAALPAKALAVIVSFVAVYLVRRSVVFAAQA